MARLYVQIPAYRDTELSATLRSLYQCAAEPSQLRVRVLWQHEPGETLAADVLKLRNLEFEAVMAHDSQGCNWARQRLQKAWDGEPFTLLLDSHHRFVPDWDTMALSMLEGLRAEGVAQPILTAYLPAYNPEDLRYRRRQPYKIYPLSREQGILTRLTSMPILKWRDIDRPVKADFVSLHFILAHGRFNHDVELDPKIYFFGDEVHTSVRAFGAGYRFFHPHRVLGWHAYDRASRKPHWADHPDWTQRHSRSIAAFRRLYRPAQKIGTSVTTVADFESYAGVQLYIK